MAFGTFSLVHPGHIYYLSEAKKLADELIVVIARDSTVKEVKGKCAIPERQRAKVVEALKPVDKVILGSKQDKYEVIVSQEPDILALGPDQEKNIDKFKFELSKRGLNPKIVRIPRLEGELYSTSKMLKFLC